MPRITVILPVYNGLPFVRHAVDSLLAQTYSDFTLHIVNDGSTDGTASYIDSIDDPRVKVTHQANAGLAVTLNRMVAATETEFVARMDADDVSLPTRLQRQVEFMDAHPDLAVVGTRGGYIMGKKSTASFGIGAKKITLSYAPPTSAAPYWDPVADGGILIHSTVMMRTELLRSVGGYPEIVPGQDLALWHRFSRAGHRLANIDEMLHLSRVCRSGISSSNLQRQYHTWRYIGYESQCQMEGIDPLPMDEYTRQHPFTRQELASLRSRARLRNALADLLSGNLPRAAYGVLVQLVTDPGIVLERIRNRI